MKLKDIVIEKINTEVTFQYDKDIEGDNNRGWRVDKITAVLDGNPVGYLKISYIPKERFKQHFKSIFDYIGKMRGRNVLPYEYRSQTLSKIPLDVLRDNLVHAWLSIDGYASSEKQQSVEAMSDEQITQEWKHIVKLAINKYGKDFKYFKNFHMDKPLVDYINVDPQYKRKGIGTALYRAGQDYLKKQGLTLHASGLQTGEAKATWDNMEHQFNIGKKNVKVDGGKTVQRRFFKD